MNERRPNRSLDGIKRNLILLGLGVTLWPESLESALSGIDFGSELVLLSSSSRRWAFNYLKAQLHITLSDALLGQETLATLTVNLPLRNNLVRTEDRRTRRNT